MYADDMDLLWEGKKKSYLRTKYLGKYLPKKRDKQIGEWRKLHNVELHNLYGYEYNKNT